MNLLGYRAFATELMKIATEVQDADIRAMIAEGKTKEYLPGGELKTNTEIETNFKPKLAGVPRNLWRAASELPEGVASVRSLARPHHYAAHRMDAHLEGKALAKHLREAPMPQTASERQLTGSLFSGGKQSRELARQSMKKEAGFMGYTPPSAYNFRGKKPTGQGSAYETASNFAATGLKGGMTGAGAATLAHTLRHGHDMKMAPRHLGTAVAVGGGIALADRALRRHAVLKQQRTQKIAMLNSESFTPARQLHSTQERGTFENKLHHGAVKPTAGIVGRNFRLPQGV
jgi:hypothetical protein